MRRWVKGGVRRWVLCLGWWSYATLSSWRLANPWGHRVQESSTWDERDVTWTLLPHPTPPIPPECRAQSPGVFNSRWTGRDMNVIAPPHPTHPPLNAEHRVQESSTGVFNLRWTGRDMNVIEPNNVHATSRSSQVEDSCWRLLDSMLCIQGGMGGVGWGNNVHVTSRSSQVDDSWTLCQFWPELT